MKDSECRCSPPQVAAYRNRISGPLLDRIDLHVQVPRVTYADLSTRPTGPASAEIRGRVVRARELQTARFSGCGGVTNASVAMELLRPSCELAGAGRNLLRSAMKQLRLSARAHDRILRTARTIADLAESNEVQDQHLAEALQFRGGA